MPKSKKIYNLSIREDVSLVFVVDICVMFFAILIWILVLVVIMLL
jgi:hypothetical protein